MEEDIIRECTRNVTDMLKRGYMKKNVIEVQISEEVWISVEGRISVEVRVQKLSEVPQRTEEPGQSHEKELYVSTFLQSVSTIFGNLVWICLFSYKSISENLQYGYRSFLKFLRGQKSQHLADVEVFIPELVENYAEDNNKYEYRFLCPHAGQFMCKLSNLVFEMEGKGEVLYRIVSWDSSLLDGLGQNPAGPLYNIDCLEGSIRHLHLPHCETRTDVVKLTVAHVTSGNVEIIQPLNVTDTHVIIHIQGLSLFGLLKSLLFQVYPIRAQVLLFYKTITGKRRMSKLHIHLLPGNVLVEEVQKQRKCNTYIETSSKCQLIPGRNYRPCCKTTDCDYVPQPEEETFDCDYGPNYHPTFEVVFKTEVDEVTLSLLDENGQEVWRPHLVLLTGTEATSTKMDPTGAFFVDKHREMLVQRVSSVMEIADCLRGSNVITKEMYSNIQAKATPQDKMRELYTCLNSGGGAVKAEFYEILREKQHYLVKELESGSGQA